MTQPDTDLVSILDSFTNYVLNERVRAYNEGFDAGIKRCVQAVREFGFDDRKECIAAIRALKDKP